MLVTLLAATLVLGCVATQGSDRGTWPDPEPLTLDAILATPSPTGTAPRAPAWSPDGRTLAFLWNDAGLPQREVWLVDRDGGTPRRLTGADAEGAGVSEFAWLPDCGALVHLRRGALEVTGLDGRTEVLLAGPAGRSDLAVSPDGRYCSFLEAGDLWLYALAEGALVRATEVGVPPITDLPLGRYARPEVEIGPPIWGGPTYAWSPDGTTIAVHHVDRRHLRVVPFPHYLGEETDPNWVRRSYPGDPNEARRVGLYSLASGELTLLDLPDPTEVRIVELAWSPDGRLLIDRESDTAVERWLHVLDPATEELETWYHDVRSTRVYTAIASAWDPDGEHLLMLSDREDRYGLYRVGPEGGEPRRLTPPGYDVTGGPYVAADSGAVFFQANSPNPYERHVFRLAEEDGEPLRVTAVPGHHTPVPSPDGSRLALLHSSDTSPTELRLASGDGSLDGRRVTSSSPPEYADRAWARARYVTFPSRIDDHTLHARILEPRELVPGERYPVVLGPVYSNTVRNRWAGRWALLQQLLVDKGYLVVQVDVRGSTGYGREFREDFLVDFAGRDLEDLESAVEYLSRLPHVDRERIGIWGSSYGGTLTVYSLLKKPGLFAAGVAGASAVDPHFFGSDDVAIVRRPDTHPEAFLRGAARYADRLEDPLLLIHGMQDQVVPFKTVVDLAEALIAAEKDFDLAIAPAGTHGWSGPPHYARFLFGKLLAHFDRHLAER